MEYYLAATLPTLLIQLPLFIVWIIGIVLAVTFWSSQRTVALLTIIALTGFLCLTPINQIGSALLPLMLNERGVDYSQIGLILSLRGFVSALIIAILWGLVLAAIFSGRDRGKSTAAIEQEIAALSEKSPDELD